MEQTPREILLKFYKEDSDLFRLLWKHSCQVEQLAIEIARKFPEGEVDIRFVSEASLLHDIGVFKTDAPKIYCFGKEPYIRHGIIGSALLNGLGLHRHALVCERHTGMGFTRYEIITENLPLPPRDMLPVSIEEKIVCYADKFYSKSSVNKKKNVDEVRKSIARYGASQLKRFEELHALLNR